MLVDAHASVPLCTCVSVSRTPLCCKLLCAVLLRRSLRYDPDDNVLICEAPGVGLHKSSTDMCTWFFSLGELPTRYAHSRGMLRSVGKERTEGKEALPRSSRRILLSYGDPISLVGRQRSVLISQ